MSPPVLPPSAWPTSGSAKSPISSFLDGGQPQLSMPSCSMFDKHGHRMTSPYAGLAKRDEELFVALAGYRPRRAAGWFCASLYLVEAGARRGASFRHRRSIAQLRGKGMTSSILGRGRRYGPGAQEGASAYTSSRFKNLREACKLARDQGCRGVLPVEVAEELLYACCGSIMTRRKRFPPRQKNSRSKNL